MNFEIAAKKIDGVSEDHNCITALGGWLRSRMESR